MKMPIGKYVDQEIKNIPTTYITHVLESFPLSQELTNALICELDNRIPSIKEFHYGQLDNSF